MEAFFDAIKWPLQSLEGIAFLEILIFFFLLYLWRAINQLKLDIQMGRRRLYEKLDLNYEHLRRSLEMHEKICNERRQEDKRWQGQIETKVSGIDRYLLDGKHKG